MGVFYYPGPVRHLYRIFEIYKALGKVYKSAGIDVKYFAKQNEILPLQDTIGVDEFNNMLINDCDLLFMWNGGKGEEQEISVRCQKLGIPVYYSELGWLPQRGTVYFDRKGVNFNSSLRDWKYSGPLRFDERQELIAKLEYYHKFIVDRSDKKEEDFVFVPFQVENDSQIVNHSARIKRMQQLVDYVCEFIPGKIVFKLHPKHDPGVIRCPDRCKLYSVGSTHDFLSHCKYVVTINSTVGVEALTYYKPVINLGDAFYENRMMTYKVNNDLDFKKAIDWARSGRAAISVIEAFLYYLFKRQWYSTDLDNPIKILSLIEKITDRQTT